MSAPRVVLVDYGLGNLFSVSKALRHEGAEVSISSDPEAIRAASRVVLPGVGAFADGMAKLRERALVDPLLEHLRSGKPFLGICLGMQLLLDRSMEFGEHAGLGFIPGTVVRIASTLKVPHVGWNRARRPNEGSAWTGTALEGMEEETPFFYFVHSFHAVTTHVEHRLAEAWYGGAPVCAAVRRDNAIGVQFHPEKSGPAGLRVLRRFVHGRNDEISA